MINRFDYFQDMRRSYVIWIIYLFYLEINQIMKKNIPSILLGLLIICWWICLRVLINHIIDVVYFYYSIEEISFYNIEFEEIVRYSWEALSIVFLTFFYTINTIPSRIRQTVLFPYAIIAFLSFLLSLLASLLLPLIRSLIHGSFSFDFEIIFFLFGRIVPIIISFILIVVIRRKYPSLSIE